MDKEDDEKTLNSILVDYNNTITRSFAFFLDEEEKLHSNNIIISFCMRFNVATSDEMLTTEALTILNHLLLLLGPSKADLQLGDSPISNATGRLQLDVWWKTISLPILLIRQRNLFEWGNTYFNGL